MVRRRLGETYDHIYVIVRFNGSEYTEPDQMVMLTRAFWSWEAAQAHLAHLREAQSGKKYVYFIQVARLEHRTTQPDGP